MILIRRTAEWGHRARVLAVVALVLPRPPRPSRLARRDGGGKGGEAIKLLDCVTPLLLTVR
ncbi:MAG: hypothetical protein LC775_19640 [Acidobacteria bacterium]|nr:hypothetical protein [Acidobacteriota bacterium]